MSKKIFMLGLAFVSFNLGFAEEETQEPISKETVLNEIEKLTEKKESLNKIFAELSEEQRTALEEEFKEQLAEYQKELEVLEQQCVESQSSQE